MGPVHLHIKNDSGLSFLIMNNQAGNIGGCATGQEFEYEFDASFTNNTNSIRFYDPKSPGDFTDIAGASWSGGGSGFDPGYQSPFSIAASGSFNGVEFSAQENGWIELQPWDLMQNGGTVLINFFKVN